MFVGFDSQLHLSFVVRKGKIPELAVWSRSLFANENIHLAVLLLAVHIGCYQETCYFIAMCGNAPANLA